MAEYINKDAYIKYLSSRKAEFIDDFGQGWCAGIDSAISACEKFPARPVVRCKDCCHSYDDTGGLVCSYGPCVDCIVPEDFYCKHGDFSPPKCEVK